jgi:hypothetical protein
MRWNRRKFLPQLPNFCPADTRTIGPNQALARDFARTQVKCGVDAAVIAALNNALAFNNPNTPGVPNPLTPNLPVFAPGVNLGC